MNVLRIIKDVMPMAYHPGAGKPPKGSPKAEKEPPFLKQQLSLDADAILNSLNKNCSFGCKKNSRGNIFCRKGYKLHLDVSA
jgi:hypothetical protein